MSTLWTPYGEHEAVPARDPGDAGAQTSHPAAETHAPATSSPDLGLPETEAAAIAEYRAQIAATPVIDVIANHAVGLWELAMLHLGADGGATNLLEARLATDAMAALVEGVGTKLGENAAPLTSALAQLRLAYVEISAEAQGGPSANDETSG